MKCFLTLLLALGCVALMPPMPPPAPKVAKHVKPPSKGDGALALLVKPKIVTPLYVLIQWNPVAGVDSYNVYQGKGPLQAPDQSWPIAATTTNTFVKLLLDKSASGVWFGITAMKNGLQSQWATR